MEQPLSFTVLLLIFIHFINASAQAPALAPGPPAPAPGPPALVPAPPALAPGPPAPTNITAILEKAVQYTIFIRLLKTTHMDDQINAQLNDSSQGMTIFAPADNAFSRLKVGMLNSFTDQQKAELVQFHTVPSFFTVAQFQTASNPLRTQAGGSAGEFPLNITTSGNNVTITTGIVNATVANTLYTDGQVAVYQVDKVLLPRMFFFPPPPPPAPAPSKPKKSASSSDSSSESVVPASDATRLARKFLSAMTCIFSALATFTFYL